MPCNRRLFLKSTTAGVAVWTTNPFDAVSADDANELFSVERIVACSGFDRKTCWVHARAGVIPPENSEVATQYPLVVMTMQKLLLTGSDVFYRIHSSRSADMGSTWTDPSPQTSFARQTVTSAPPAKLPRGVEMAPELIREGDETTVCDFVPAWHAASQRLLGIGQTVWYRDNRVMHPRPRGIAYASYDLARNRWSAWDIVGLPDESRFQNAGSGSAQRVDLVGGDVLVPFYFKQPSQRQYSVTVARCRFDGQTLHYVEHGNALTIAVDRGLYEPSLTHFRGKYYQTLRNDRHAYVTVSRDGLNYEPPRPWTYDDGHQLGSYNTQQHWVAYHDALFLVYTRRGADNDHVFRHRAPLFIAQVDPARLTVIRETEQIIVPERGARLGNFGVVDVSPDQTWVTAAEWMQPAGVEKHGSDNSVFIAKLKWNRPNKRFSYWSNAMPPGGDGTSWKSIQAYFRPPKKWKDKLGNYASPLQFSSGTIASSVADWRLRRQELFQQWSGLLGHWPDLITKQTPEVLESARRENFMQHRIRFQWTPDEFTIGYLLIPDGAAPKPAAISVYYEPETAIGLGTPHRDFALQLARRGFVTLSIGTTEATKARTYSLYYPSIEKAEVQPLSMLAYAAANAWHVLANRAEVDAERIGIVGHSFGGKWAMFAACLFDRFACAAWSDPGIVFDESRPNINYWEPWYLGYHPRPWRQRGVITSDNPAKGLYPRLRASGRDLHELHALMAPRPFLVSGGAEDPIHRWEALNHTVTVNRLLGQDDRVAMTNRPDHSPNQDSNEVIYSFFMHFLG